MKKISLYLSNDYKPTLLLPGRPILVPYDRPWMAHLWQPPLHSFILGVASRGADGEGEQRVNCVVNSSIGREDTYLASVLRSPVLGGRTQSVQMYCLHQYREYASVVCTQTSALDILVMGWRTQKFQVCSIH